MWKSRVVTSIRTILTAKTGILTKEGHQLISSTVKWSRAILQCGQVVKQ